MPNDIEQLLQNAQSELSSRPDQGPLQHTPEGYPYYQSNGNAPQQPQDNAQPQPIAQEPTDVGTMLKSAQTELQSRGGFSLPRLDPKTSNIANVVAGFNEEIAKGLSIPPEAANELLDMIGLRIFKPGQAQQFIKQKFRQADIAVDPIDTWSKKVGENGLVAMLGLGAIFRSAQAVEAGAGPAMKASKLVAHEITDFISKHPILATITDQASSAGGTITQEALGKPKTPGEAIVYPLATVAGSMLGGMVGAGVSGRLSRAGDLIARGGKAIANRIFGSQTTNAVEPLAPHALDLTNTNLRQYSEDQLDASIQKVDSAIKQAVHSVPLKGAPEELQFQFRKRLGKAYEIARRIEGSFWKRVDMKRPVPMAGIRKDVAEMSKELADKPSVKPQEFMDKLNKLSMPVRGPRGKMQKSLPSIERLRDVRNEIRIARNSEQASPSGNDGLIANYNRLESIIDKGIADAYPKDVTLQQARNISIKLHDMFDRSNLGALFAKRQSGQLSILPEQSIEKLLPRFKGLSDIADVSRKMVYLRAPGGKGFALTQPERQEIQLLRKDAEDAVQSIFHEQANTLGPEKSAKWFVANEKRIKPLAEAAANIDYASRKIVVGLQERDMIEKSALSKFIQYDPEIAIKRVFNDPKDPVRINNEILKTVKTDPEAYAAYQKGMVRQFFNQARNDPQKAWEMLNTNRYRTMMHDTLPESVYKRFYQVVKFSYGISQGESKNFMQKMAVPLKLAARVAAAQFGHVVARFSGGGTVQTPAIASGVAARYMDRLLKWTNANELMANAVVDPKWEAVLQNRMFSNRQAMQASLKRMRKVLSIIEGSRLNIQNLLPQGQNNGRRKY